MAVTVVVGLLVASLLLVALPYRRQIVSYLTHWKGSPTHTVAYVPFDPAAEAALHIAVLGDVGDSGSRLAATADAVARIDGSDPFDSVLLLGDNVYPAGDPKRLQTTVFQPFAPELDHGAALLAILGNHDVRDGHADSQVAALGMPGRWWARTFDDVLVVGLDSNATDDPDQLAWLEETLAASAARWKIVAVHHPPYSAGYQGSDHGVRDRFSPLFARYGVQLVLSGHEHDYQRSVPIDGVTYVITGGASGTRRTGERDFTAVSFSWHHFVDLHVFADRAVLRAVNQSGRVADEFVLRR
ncbi:MAG TPA: metallophosphoesterase [Acidimicrobiia bacterium]|nr:metallophosphoesterase [Acidimicrobiia bacterium]